MNYNKKIVSRVTSKILILFVCTALALPAQAATLDEVKIALLTLQKKYVQYQNNQTTGTTLGTTTRSWWKPNLYTTWQWQLTGTIDQSVDVQMFDIDLFDTSAATIASLKSKGKIVICYFSAGSYEDWRPDASQFPAAILGKSNGWAGEKWLDIRNLSALGPVMESRLDLAVSKGCHGVEPDNIDGYTNSTGFPLTGSDQIIFNKWLAEKAHARNLSIGLKNDIDQVVALEPYFDWALNEQCFQYNECDTLLPFITAGKPVFTTEYKLKASSFCKQANKMKFMSMKKKLNLNASREVCWTENGNVPVATPIPTPSATATSGVIKMFTTDSVNVRKTPAGRKIGIQTQGSVGYKLGKSVRANDRNWINMDFIAGTDGYVAENYLKPVN